MKLSIVGAGAGLLLLGGCATFTGGELVQPGQPVSTLIVRNNTGMLINALTISKCNAMSHGLNRLSSGDAIPHGGTRRFQISPGCWDVMAGSSSGSAASNQRYNAEANSDMEMTFDPVG